MCWFYLLSKDIYGFILQFFALYSTGGLSSLNSGKLGGRIGLIG